MKFSKHAGDRAPVTLITGASSGIGAHLAVLQARQNHRLALAARRADKLAEVGQACAEAGAAVVEIVEMDVSSSGSVDIAVERVAGLFGRIDVLVNNAGIAGNGSAIDTEVVEFDRIMATNLRGAWLTATATARHMKTTGGGQIVNVASILGLRVAGGVAPYAISKAGVVQMTRALALEWARHDIRVNALAPGYIETDLNKSFFSSEAGQQMMKRIPQRRLGRLTDLDAPFLMLASGASPYLTGAVLPVDGGHHISSL